MGDALNEPRRTYESLWCAAVTAFAQNQFQVDAHLQNKAADFRRGLTLILRPGPAVREAFTTFVDQLKLAAPGQYFYRPEEWHVTVLSIIPGSEHWQEKMPQLAAYQACVEEVMKGCQPFSIRFRGVTASPAAVMIQGIPPDDALAQIRDGLRASLQRAGFGDQLDVRYKINTAHVTVMRFSHGNTNGKNLLALLTANRTTDFGAVNVGGLELIFGDWYASAESSRTVQAYKLPA